MARRAGPPLSSAKARIAAKSRSELPARAISDPSTGLMIGLAALPGPIHFPAT